MEKIFAIGDIHGCLDKLESLLCKIPADLDRDMMVFLGDYVDRGPDSFKVLELLLDLKKKHGERMIFLQGNHEWMFSRYIEDNSFRSFLFTGGRKTLESYPVQDGCPEIPPSHMEFLKELTPVYETEQYIFVHAGLKPGIPVSRQRPEDLLWIRSEFIRSSYDWGKRVIFGHTPFFQPLIEANKVGIDTGAVFGGQLTCLSLPDFEFFFA
ncbi:MAG TPA: serine/threonine protein phosphatase [Thermodesulfobacteriaceae bacterium]|nr:serine/threonine protein phosphatase [Thermodesulfobacteriaceae bacterium]